MLKISFVSPMHSFELPPLEAGQSGSLTDYKGKSSIVVFSCFKNHSTIFVSDEGASMNFGPEEKYKAVVSKKHHLEKKLKPGERYERDFTYKLAKGKLVFEHDK